MLFGLSEESVSDAGVVSPPADLVIGEGAMTNEILAYDFLTYSLWYIVVFSSGN